MCAKISLEEVKELGGDDGSTLPWKSLTKLDVNKIYTVNNIYRMPSASGLAKNQIVAELDDCRTSLPERFVNRLYNDEASFSAFVDMTKFLVFRGTRRTKSNYMMAIINTTLPTYPNGCVCPTVCSDCECDDHTQLGNNCPCWASKQFGDFDSFFNKLALGAIKITDEVEINNQLGLFDLASTPAKKKKTY